MLDSIEIDNSKAAAVFAHARQRQILLALVDREHSLSGLRFLTETPLNLLHHHIRKFIRLGLVIITRLETRAGAPVKIYRAVAHSFFVPAPLMDTPPGAGLTRHLREMLDRDRLATLKGVAYGHDANGPRMRIVKEMGVSKPSAELWMKLHLSPTDASALADDFRALLRTYEARSRVGRQRYIVHAALAADEP